ncbi:MAG: LamG-like jellyroll fold domain-containing protein [Bacteroidota bacterium]
MKLNFFLLTLVTICFTAMSTIAQIDDGLRAYYSFDNCDATDETTNGSDGTMFGDIECACGISGQALRFDGVDDYVVFFGFVNTYFDDDDFSVSFYFKNYGTSFQRSLLSKKATCTNDQNFDVRLITSQNRLATELSISDDLNAISYANLVREACWQHVIITRNNTVLRTYINGELADQATSAVILDVDNNAILSLANSPCIGFDGTRRFQGLVDELRVFNRAISLEEIQNLYVSPDMIVNRDTLVFTGGSVDITTTPTCATDFNWMSATGVDDPFAANASITPDTTTTYTLEFIDEFGCVATDTILITVVDPTTIGCTDVLLPTAFTPNGDGLNDEILISNPFSISELLSFEIFDRSGSRVFATNNAFEGWSGTFKGKDLDPGIFVYQVRFICEGLEKLQAGTITLLK